MLRKLKVHGFRTLVGTDISFDPLTIMIGKNGVGKTSILDALQLIGNFARGGTERAFGPPPWSLGWQRARGFGRIHDIRFEVELEVPSGQSYSYTLSLGEREGQVRVEEERLTRLADRQILASFNYETLKAAGTILNPAKDDSGAQEIRAVSNIFRSVVSYELNPSVIEQGNSPEQQFVGRDGFGVAGFLAHLKDDEPETFEKLQNRLKQFRPETESIDVWSGGQSLFWGLREEGLKLPFAAVHLSWGDRQLVGLLCVLYYCQDPGTTIAIEEIDRGFHPSRFGQVVELLSEAAYDGLDGNPPLQIVITTHSPSFLNKLGDRLQEIRMVTRVANGSTHVRPLRELVQERLGTDSPEQPLGEIWEMGLLDDLIEEAMK